MKYYSSKAAAEMLGISVLTLYDWLKRSDLGTLVIRGVEITIAYYQSGRRGQGRIQIAEDEIERVREAMLVRPVRQRLRRRPQKRSFPGIHVELGNPIK